MSGIEQELVAEASASNWIAPMGPDIDAFEREFAADVGCGFAVALVSGTAALHLALQLVGVERNDEVLVSTLTFSASVNAIRYLGGIPVLMDSERISWNMDPDLLREALHQRARRNRLPRAVLVVHLFGQSANLDAILSLCQEHGVALVEDAAEALGATYRGKAPGTFGRAGVFSFNGNKIITTSGGGMLVTDDEVIAAHARKLATQERDPAPRYEHSEIGDNYRLSNVLAALGRGQLRSLEDRVLARRSNFAFYQRALESQPGIALMPEAPWGRHTRWLTALTVDPDAFGASAQTVRLALEAEHIEARPIWKPMHMQPIFRHFESVGGAVAEDLFQHGLCLPSGSSLTPGELERVVAALLATPDCRSPAAPDRAALRGAA